MDLSRLEGKTVFITGASGLVGKALVSLLSSYKFTAPVKIIAAVRNVEKAKKAFSELSGNIEYLNCDVCNLKPENMGVDYAMHCAGQTSSKKFVEEPVEVILNNIKGTENVLKFCKANDVKGMVYLSTMEVYGTPETDSKINEEFPCNLNVTSVRSCYPESKRACESLCASYAKEYGVPAKIVRLTQTFGPGVSYNDGRVFAEFARCVIEGKDIVLKTKGETKRNYLYTADAATAILTVLLNGESGEAYNAANEQTYCSVYSMAHAVAEKFGVGKTKVRICEEKDAGALGYAPTLKMNLSCDKLKKLGWKAETDLMTAFSEMILHMKNRRESELDTTEFNG
jgi:nucleoside-diphosphate-sugar epimerase